MQLRFNLFSNKQHEQWNVLSSSILQSLITTLLPSDRIGVKDAAIIQKLGERIEAALHYEIAKRPSDQIERVRTVLFERILMLHQLSQKHNILLNNLKLRHPSLEFPPLHKELFSQDHYNNNNNNNSNHDDSEHV